MRERFVIEFYKDGEYKGPIIYLKTKRVKTFRTEAAAYKFIYKLKKDLIDSVDLKVGRRTGL